MSAICALGVGLILGVVLAYIAIATFYGVD